MIRWFLVFSAITALLLGGCGGEHVSDNPAVSQDIPTVVAGIPRPAAPPRPQTPQISITPETPKTPAENAPRIAFEKTTHDFGQIGPASQNVAEFAFTNTGKSTLDISEITKTCSCTPFTLDKTKYAPGESGVIKVRYHAGTAPGSTIRKLYVKSNDPAKPNIALTMTARIFKGVLNEPQQLTVLLKPGTRIKPITLTSKDDEAFSIVSIRSAPPGITADFDRNAKATTFTIQPKIDREVITNSVHGRIDIALTHSKCKRITVPYHAVGEFRLTPPRLVLFNAEPEKPISRKLWILNNFNKDFEIAAIDDRNGYIEVVKTEKFQGRYSLELRITPPPAQGNKTIFGDVLTIKTDQGDQLTVDCRGFYTR